MLRSLVIRLASSIGVFLVIAVGLFTLVRAAPGDPAETMIPPDAAPGIREQLVQHARVELGLNKPLPVQFVLWFGNLLRGNLGYSFSTHQAVDQLLVDRLGPTLLLMGGALVIGIIIAIPLGVITAVRHNTAVDSLISSVSVVALAIPSFFLAMLGIYVFAVKLRVLPSAGMYYPGDSGISDLLYHLILPVLVLALAAAAAFTRYIRSGMLEQLEQDYIRAILAKGASPLRAIAHALRNSLIPLVTVLALYIPVFMGGAVVVEQIFSWPGMGQLAVQALTLRDYPVITGFGLYVAVLVLVCNLAADILYTVVDPRVRTGP